MRASTALLVIAATGAAVAGVALTIGYVSKGSGLGYSGQSNTGSDKKTGSSGDWGEQSAALIGALGGLVGQFRSSTPPKPAYTPNPHEGVYF